jgi:hypothetical protein
VSGVPVYSSARMTDWESAVVSLARHSCCSFLGSDPQIYCLNWISPYMSTYLLATICKITFRTPCTGLHRKWSIEIKHRKLITAV